MNQRNLPLSSITSYPAGTQSSSSNFRRIEVDHAVLNKAAIFLSMCWNFASQMPQLALIRQRGKVVRRLWRQQGPLCGPLYAPSICWSRHVCRRVANGVSEWCDMCIYCGCTSSGFSIDHTTAQACTQQTQRGLSACCELLFLSFGCLVASWLYHLVIDLQVGARMWMWGLPRTSRGSKWLAATQSVVVDSK